MVNIEEFRAAVQKRKGQHAMKAITKYERIIIKEREIKTDKCGLENWKKYEKGEKDIYAENEEILSDAIEEIARITKCIAEDKEELEYILEDFYDEHYYDYNNAKESANDFKENYEKIILKEANKRYSEKIKYYSTWNAKKKCNETQERIEQQQEELSEMKNKLNLYQRIKLKYIRKSPTARINSSPSFIMYTAAEQISDGFKEGIAKMTKSVAAAGNTTAELAAALGMMGSEAKKATISLNQLQHELRRDTNNYRKMHGIPKKRGMPNRKVKQNGKQKTNSRMQQM